MKTNLNLFFSLICTLFLASCINDDSYKLQAENELKTAMNQWNNTAVSSYQFIERSSGFIGVFEVKHLVDPQGAIVDDYGCITSDLNCEYYGSDYEPEPKTIGDVYALLSRAINEADYFQIQYDFTYGYPKFLSVDWDEDAVDDEMGYDWLFSFEGMNCISENDQALIACPEIYDPVCGCDLVTYGNTCEARANGVRYFEKGACP